MIHFPMAEMTGLGRQLLQQLALFNQFNQIPLFVLNVPVTDIHDLYRNREIFYWDGPLNWDKGCFSNIALLLRMLWVVVCFHSRRLTICKHYCVRHISWAFRSAISGKQTMFTNCKTSAMEADNNSQHTQQQCNVWTATFDTFLLHVPVHPAI